MQAPTSSWGWGLWRGAHMSCCGCAGQGTRPLIRSRLQVSRFTLTVAGVSEKRFFPLLGVNLSWWGSKVEGVACPERGGVADSMQKAGRFLLCYTMPATRYGKILEILESKDKIAYASRRFRLGWSTGDPKPWTQYGLRPLRGFTVKGLRFRQTL